MYVDCRLVRRMIPGHGEIVNLININLIQLRQNQSEPGVLNWTTYRGWRQATKRVVVIVSGRSNLLEIVFALALRAASRACCTPAAAERQEWL